MISPHMNLLRTLVLAALGLTAGCASKPSSPVAPPVAGPPVAPVKVVVDDYHGTKVEDPYRYMETFTDPAVQAWVKGQGEYAATVLAGIPGRDAILGRVRELDEGAPF